MSPSLPLNRLQVIMSNANYSVVNSPDHLEVLLSADLKRITIIYFWTPWAEPCHKLNNVVKELTDQYPAALFLQVCNNPMKVLILHLM